MKLFIDTSSSEKVIIKIDEKEFQSEARLKTSQKLLPFIESTLKDEGKTLKDISEIEVMTGPGSFTGLRVGVSVANALGWSLKVPVNGKLLPKNVSEIKYS
jgi:tRNA threonylcarbamoyladenosine biosynthesis protein TsaB